MPLPPYRVFKIAIIAITPITNSYKKTDLRF
jgi:hypothetical protein